MRTSTKRWAWRLQKPWPQRGNEVDTYNILCSGDYTDKGEAWCARITRADSGAEVAVVSGFACMADAHKAAEYVLLGIAAQWDVIRPATCDMIEAGVREMESEDDDFARTIEQKLFAAFEVMLGVDAYHLYRVAQMGEDASPQNAEPDSNGSSLGP